MNGNLSTFLPLSHALLSPTTHTHSAALKLPTTTSKADRASRVGSVIDQLALAGCRDVRIGSVLARGISGGQAKRTNIALAIVSRPKILFLDEPTSGLDSYTSNKVRREKTGGREMTGGRGAPGERGPLSLPRSYSPPARALSLSLSRPHHAVRSWTSSPASPAPA